MNKHIGPTLESVFDELGEREAFEAGTVKKMVALQLRARMKATGVTPTELAHAMKTSRAAVSRLLDPANASMTLETLTKAARAVRSDVLVCLVDKGAVRARRRSPRRPAARIRRASVLAARSG
jgi:antitoxin HicB